jgi:predicted nucleic acid-binding protein
MKEPFRASGYRRVGLDTMVFIYAFEDHPVYQSLLRPLFRAVERGDLEAVTSTLTLAECLAQPYRKKDMALVARYKVLFRNFPHLAVLPLNEEIAERTAVLRARYALRTPDAIQMATASIAKVDVFLTNDAGLPFVEDLNVLLLDRMIDPVPGHV